jgi:YYY domain-containing protein
MMEGGGVLRLDRIRARRVLGVILAAGALLRLIGLNWDSGHHLHPDERFISMVEEKLEFPTSPAEYFDSKTSPLNPYNRGHDSFVYGTLPMFVTKVIARAMHQDGYGGAHFVGRALSSVADLFSVWLAYLLVRRFSRDRRPALAAAAFLAFCPLGIQLSHFWNVDTYLTAFSTAALLGAVRLAQGRSTSLSVAATGVAIGLAVACKVTALALLLPLGLGVLIGALRDGIPRETRSAAIALGRAAGYFLLAVFTAGIAVRVALPYAFQPGFFSFGLDPRYFNDMKRLADLSSTVSGFPPAFQWAGRTILFPLKNFVLWGAGPFFGLAALAALVWGILELRRKPRRALLPVLAHALFLIAYHGTTTVKSIRYFYPAYPALAVLAALFLFDVAPRLARSGLGSRIVRLVPAIVVAGTFLWGLAFTSIYRREHPRVTAARWIYENIPPPARIGNESWDDGQPLPLPDHDPGPYAGPVLPLFDPDSSKKVEDVVKALKGSDWVAVTSNRVYGNVTRIPEVFPMSRAYYSALFDGRLGFELAADFSSYPSLGPLKLPDDGAEEQFTVYDHPRVLLFRRTPRFSPERATQILLAAIPRTPPTLGDWEKFPRSRRIVSAPIRPPRHADAEKTARRAPIPELKVGSVGSAFIWYLAILLVGAAAFPLAHAFFPRLADRGAGVARILGLAATTYLLAILVQLRALSNGRAAAWLCLVALAVASAALGWKRRALLVDFFRGRWRLVLAGEIVFAAGFLLFLGIRALNPEIFWGEKPMDFSILNILVRTRSLPASDPWFAGAPLGYYTFGQQMVAFLTLLTGLSTRFTFNLAFGLLGGLLLQGAFTLGRNWGGRLSAGIATAALTGILGNLAGLREWLVNHRALDWHYFWATSRVIKDTINEYPFWSLVFADLHAHVLAMPIFLLVATAALHFVRIHAAPPARVLSRVASGTILGFAAGVQALTNAWDVPLLAGILLIVFLVAATAEGFGPARAARALSGAAAALVAAAVTVLPLWVHGGGGPGWGWEREPGAKGVDVLTVFGLFFFLAFAWWLSVFSRKLSEQGFAGERRLVLVGAVAVLLGVIAVVSVEVFALAGVLLFAAVAFDRTTEPDERLACAFAASAFFLIAFTQRVYISDRMNTFFKLYLEAWLLFAITTAALVFRGKDRPGAFGRWPVVARGAFGLLVLAALFTTVTAARGAVSNHFAPYSGPSLDGLRHLEESRPGEHRAIQWLRHNLRGTPVILEAQGDPYQDFGRISMNTGLPTVLGWEHHVKQRGNPESEVIERREAIRRIYSETDPAAVERLLRRYHVGYVYSGWLERKTYPPAGLRKFDTAKDLFELAYENRDAKIYRVIGGDSEDVIMPAREDLPEPAGGGEVIEEEQPPAISEKPEEGRAPFSGMKEPRDGDLDGRGRLWIADFGNSRIRIFDSDGGFLGGWGGRGDATHALREPSAIAIAGDDVYVADTWNGRVQSFSLAGEWRAKAVELYGPRGVAVAKDGRVWVTDTGNHRIVSFDGALEGRQVFGKLGSAPGDFSSPVGIAVGPSGSVYVADTGNRRIQVLDDNGVYQRSVTVRGWEGPVEPHLEVGDDETLYATDPAASVVLAFDLSGVEIGRWKADDEGSPFDKPTGLALDRKAGILYVVNSGNSRVMKLTVTSRKAS